MATRVVTVYRFEYEKFAPKSGEMVNWITFIAGYGQKDAEQYLHLAVGDVTIRTIGTECRLDAISDDVRKAIIASAQPAKRKPGRPKKDE